MSKKTTPQTITPEQVVAAIETMTVNLTRSFDAAADRIGAALTAATAPTIKVDGRQGGALVLSGLYEAAERRPLWADISTDPTQPTLGRVKWKRGGPAETRFMYRSAGCLFDSDADEYVDDLAQLESVELLHAVTPELLDYTLSVYREAGREDTDGYRALLALATGVES